MKDDIAKRAAAMDDVNLLIRFSEAVETEYPWVAKPRALPEPTFLPLMRRPCRSVEKESAETCMRALLERTCAELRLKNDG